MISAATYRLVEGLFTYEDRGQPQLKGVSTPLTLYRVVKESAAHSRFDVAVQAGLTPLVGREEELALLRRRWEQATDGEGQVVLAQWRARHRQIAAGAGTQRPGCPKQRHPH